MKEYLVVPMPSVITHDKNHQREVFDEIQRQINLKAEKGWTYYSMEHIIARQRKMGCLSGDIDRYREFLIFVREKENTILHEDSDK